jgi:hypothetical protein
MMQIAGVGDTSRFRRICIWVNEGTFMEELKGAAHKHVE